LKNASTESEIEQKPQTIKCLRLFCYPYGRQIGGKKISSISICIENKKNRSFQRNKRFNMVRPVRFERMAFGVGAVLYEVFASQRLLKRRSSPTFCVVFVYFLHLLGLPIFGGSSLVVAAVALAIL
jgi:hypothetical protein